MKTLLALITASLALTAPALAKPVAFDVLATYAPPGLTNASPTHEDGRYHIGLAVGPRFGNKIAVVPIVNYLPKYTASANGHDTFRPGLLVVTGSKHIDFGVGVALRPVADHTYILKAGSTPIAVIVAAGVRL
jgi:hypothetical protein